MATGWQQLATQATLAEHGKRLATAGNTGNVGNTWQPAGNSWQQVDQDKGCCQGLPRVAKGCQQVAMLLPTLPMLPAVARPTSFCRR
jgi:hypothetical protein